MTAATLLFLFVFTLGMLAWAAWRPSERWTDLDDQAGAERRLYPDAGPYRRDAA